MTRTQGSNRPSDLYVMQAECGLVKVGRSTNPESRRVMLAQKLRQQLVLIAILPDRGVDEEAIHIKLKKHLVIGEWFYGTEAGKIAVAKIVGMPRPDWPFAWDAATSDKFRRSIEVANYKRALLGQRRKVIKTIVFGAADKFTNAKIWSALDDDHITRSDHGVFFAAIGGGSEQWLLPDYLASLGAAHSLGPPGWSMPPNPVSPAEVVVAALEALTAYQRGLSLDND